MLLPAAGLVEDGVRQQRHARRQARHAVLQRRAALPAVLLGVVHVHILHAAALVVRAPAQDVDAVVQHDHAGFSVPRGHRAQQ